MFQKINSWLLLFAGAIGLKNKKTPSASLTNGAIIYVADASGAGTAAVHVRTEDGNVVKLYPGAALTAANATALNTGDATSDTVITNMRTRIGELEARLVAIGLIES